MKRVVVAMAAIAALAAAVVLWRRWKWSDEKDLAGEVEKDGATENLCLLEFEKKPQKSFRRVLADNSYKAFKHLKREEDSREISSERHAFEYEITLLLEQGPELPKFFCRDICPDLSVPYVWVSTKDQLESLAKILQNEHVFAVDTEQHSLRSYLGFTALMQISTQEQDFLLDTIALHDVMSTLQPVFSSRTICKVFHGSDNDILWLQRDFHIYVVNLFDTAKACLVLSKPKKSLAYLLENYCGVYTDKALQLEDWRTRPLSPEMMQYARADAHYLLYIAACLVSELEKKSEGVQADLVREAAYRSNAACLQLYSKETEPSGMDSTAVSLYSRYSDIHRHDLKKDHEEIELIRRLCVWRDLMARIHDESTRYVLSDQAIFYLGINAPQTEDQVYDLIIRADSDVIFPNSPSHVVKSHVEELSILIQGLQQNPEDIFRRILQIHLEPSNHCPISLYNYALLSKLEASTALFQKRKGLNRVSLTGPKASRALFVQKFSCKAPVYHNCRIYASDGRLLCYSDQRKIEWYLRRGLAKIVEEDPLAVMLLFEPKGRPEDEDNVFYVQSKKNMCVGCGEKSHYLRYRIIPSCYRVHFPEHLKSHRSHDIVLLCVDCHEVAHSATERYKKQVAMEFKVPLFVKKIVGSGEKMVPSESIGEEEVGVSPLQLRTAAMALLRHGRVMPPDRREELLMTVKSYFGGREISEQDLERVLFVGMSARERRRLEKKRGLPLRPMEAANSSEEERTGDRDGEEDENNRSAISAGSAGHSIATCNKISKKLSLLGHGVHGKQVVEHLLKEYGDDGVLQFCQRWRQVFVEAIQPRFLPSGWDIMHRGRREFGEFSVYSSSGKNAEQSSQ
ncbi:polynucleotidyl transferase, ribonuclease H fold protein with HRDC domain-containing protein isoform X1 [Wolffia australiana]